MVSDLGLHCLPTFDKMEARFKLNEVNITPRVLEISSWKFSKM